MKLLAFVLISLIALCVGFYYLSNNDSLDGDEVYVNQENVNHHINPNENIISFGNVCPGSKATPHAGCSMVVHFPNVSCTDVREEIVARIKANQDPKSHQGKYKMIHDYKNATHASRTTGDGTNYTDLFIFTYANLRNEISQSQNLEGNKGCKVTACSESQANSLYDFSTNYCNLYNLYCQAKKTSEQNEGDGKVVPCKKTKT